MARNLGTQLQHEGRTGLTYTERQGLKAVINLADGHARRDPVRAEQPILQSLQDIFSLSLRYDALDLEEKFVSSYLGLSGQRTPDGIRPLVFFSASEAISVAARVLAEHEESCAVLEPTLDVIPMLLRSTGLDILPFRESLLHDTGMLVEHAKRCTAIFVTLPNNPTGLVLDEAYFKRLCEACARANKALIIDACFRLYAPPMQFNCYQILADSGIDWMVIEDTGKIWATNGLKAGVLVCSDRYAPTASKAFHELVLSISPFVLTLLWQLSERGGVQAIKEIQDLIDRNRSLVRLTLEDSSVFTPSMVRSSMPVETVYYDHDRFPDQSRMLDDLRSRGLGVVGSNDFYWSSTQHVPFLRLALSRNEAVVRQGADVLASFQ